MTHHLQLSYYYIIPFPTIPKNNNNKYRVGLQYGCRNARNVHFTLTNLFHNKPIVRENVDRNQSTIIIDSFQQIVLIS